MTNWEVRLMHFNKPLDFKRVIVNSDNIQTAYELAEAITPDYVAVSARFHSTDLAKEFGYGYGPVPEEA